MTADPPFDPGSHRRPPYPAHAGPWPFPLPGMRPTLTAPPPLRHIRKARDAGDLQIHFGKYSGHTWDEVAEINSGYLRWIADNKQFDSKTRRYARSALDRWRNWKRQQEREARASVESGGTCWDILGRAFERAAAKPDLDLGTGTIIVDQAASLG